MGGTQGKENAVYLAFRDIRASVGRFVLIGSVVGLVTLLIVMLTGLTAGLGKQNTSALEELGPDRFIATTSDDGEFSFTGSAVGADATARWEATDGMDAVTPLGITQTRMTSGGGEGKPRSPWPSSACPPAPRWTVRQSPRAASSFPRT